MTRFLSILLLAALAGYFGFTKWTAHVLRYQVARQEAMIEKSLSSDDPRSALPLLSKLPPLARTVTHEAQQKRLNLMVCGYAAVRDFPKLLELYRGSPAAILSNETASVLLARHFLALGQAGEVAALRTPWEAQPRGRAVWLLFDADVLLGKGERDAALALLKGTMLKGADEALRRVRLAMLAAKGTDFTAAWNELALAEKADTRNADVRAFRAQLLEAAGKRGLARVEYVAAVMAERRNPIWLVQLADFYRRDGQLDLMLDTLVEAEASTGVDSFAMKVAFWSRMLRSTLVQSKSGSSAHKVSSTQLGSVASYVRQHLRWSEDEAHGLVGIERLQAVRPEILWLRVVAALQQGDEKAAFELLQAHHHKTSSLNPELENALLCTLSWRLAKRLCPPSLKLATVPVVRGVKKGVGLKDDGISQQHPFLRELSAARVAQAQHDSSISVEPLPEALRKVLDGPHAFTAAFIAAGWRQAALSLLPGANESKAIEQVADTAPMWLPYGIAQCLRANVGPQAAIDFIARQTVAGSELRLLAAESELSLTNTSRAQTLLAALATEPSDVGYRAAWLLAGIYFEQKQPEAAERTVQQCAPLSAAPLGKELLATAALARKDEASARKLYESIVSESVQARTYLARQAMTAKDYTTAEKLTQELIALMPDKLQLRANLVAILEAKGSSPGMTQ